MYYLSLHKSRFGMTFSAILGVSEILYSFRLVLEEKIGKEIPESSRLEFLEKFLGTNFAFSDAEGNTFWLLNRVGITYLSLLRTLLAIHQKSLDAIFWEVMDSSFISICKFGRGWDFSKLAVIEDGKFLLEMWG